MLLTIAGMTPSGTLVASTCGEKGVGASPMAHSAFPWGVGRGDKTGELLPEAGPVLTGREELDAGWVRGRGRGVPVGRSTWHLATIHSASE